MGGSGVGPGIAKRARLAEGRAFPSQPKADCHQISRINILKCQRILRVRRVRLWGGVLAFYRGPLALFLQ